VPTTVNPPLAERAYAELRDLIVTLRLPPGSPVQEDALGDRLRVGRTPLREAVKRLEAERLVVIHPRRGTFVAEVNLTDHAMVSDVRRELEGHAAARAARRATAEERTGLRALAASLPDAPADDRAGREQGMRLDTEVHRAIHRAAHNGFLEADLGRYLNLSLRIWYLVLDRLPPVDLAGEHVPMLEAIADGDARRARRLAAAHVEHFERSVRAAL
jgi:DNA-binding GntR family transcriptional regulator